MSKQNKAKMIPATKIIHVILIVILIANIVHAIDDIRIDIEIPQTHNSEKLDVSGTTEKSASVVVLVNGMKQQEISPENNPDGKFTLNLILAKDSTNKIKITASKEDKSAEKEFDVTVDTNSPTLVIEPIKDILIEKNLVVKGKVSKEVTVDIFLGRGKLDNVKPAKVSGLKVADSENNLMDFVHIEWNKNSEDDIDKYIIYREDVGILDTNPSGTVFVRDLKVNSDTEYVYRVAALDASGNVGDKSEPLKIKTLAGDRKNIPKPIGQKVSQEIDRAVKSVKTTNTFEEEIPLSSDGDYHITIIATDNAGNRAIYKKNFLLDTKGPKIESITPRSGSFIYEYAANSVKIEGVTSPNVEVKLFLDKNAVEKLLSTTLTEQQALLYDKDVYQKLKESYSTKSDDKGRFVFNKVNLLNYVSANFAPTEVDPKDFNRNNDDTQGISRQNSVEIVILAADKFGRFDQKRLHYRLGTCWSGNLTWDVRVLSEFQSPTFLSTERLAEGTETIYFYLNFSYLGESSDAGARIQSLQLANACDDFAKDNPRYNISCSIMKNNCVTKSSSNKRTWYVACPLAGVDGMDRWLKDDWKSFAKAVHNEMSFPFRIRIGYTERKQSQDANDNTIDSRQVQTTCDEVSYVVDSSKIDPRSVLPDFLLRDSIKWLNSSIKAIDKAQGYVRTVLNFVGIGCVGSILFKFGTTVWRETTCNLEGVRDRADATIPKNLKCPLTKEDRNKLTNQELLERCPSCSAQWDFESKLYGVYRGLCDRVFCHTAPAKWTESKPDDELVKKQFEIKTQCGEKDESLQGQPLLERSCSAWLDEDLDREKISAQGAGDTCYQAQIIREDDAAKSKYGMVFIKSSEQAFRESGVYKFTAVSKVSENQKSAKSSVEKYYTDDLFVKEFKGRFMTARTDMCADVCNKRGYTNSTCGDSNDAVQLENPTVVSNRQEAYTKLFGNGFNSAAKYKTLRVGYTADCLFGNYEKEKSVMSKPPTKDYTDGLLNKQANDLPHEDECICVNEDSVELGKYYTAKDVSSYETDPTKSKQLFPDTQDSEYPPFDYRYYKIKFKAKSQGTTEPITSTANTDNIHDRYNPARYLEGRDQYACFGQDDWVSKALGRGDNTLTLDPFRSHTAAFQCGCISGINNRLNTVKNLMSAMQNCLITVKETGTADAGVCKELFTQHVCGLAWQAISSFTNQCNPESSEANSTYSEPGIKTIFSQGLKSVYTASEETQKEIQEEYGNAQLTNLLGFGEEGISRKICLAAFGYDWNLDMDNIIGASYTTPYSTLVLPATKSREFLTYDPKTYSAVYEYRSSWLINPGCDIRDYDVYLSCVSQNEMGKYDGIDCTKQDDETGNCACLSANLEKEQTLKFYDGKRLAQGSLENRDRHEVITSQYKYDHLKFVLRPDARIRGAANVRQGQAVSNLAAKCLPEGHENGVFYYPIKDKSARDLKICYVDSNTGTFSCPQADLFFGQRVTAYFDDDGMMLNEIPLGQYGRARTSAIEIPVGSDIKLTSSVWKAQGKDVCLHIYSPENKQIDFMTGINYVGKSEYPEAYISQATITNNRMEFVDQIDYEIINDMIGAGAISPNADISTTITFRDSNNDGVIDLDYGSEDKVHFTDSKFISGIDEEKDGISIAKYKESQKHVDLTNKLDLGGEPGIIIYKQDLKKNEMFILITSVTLPGAQTGNPQKYVEKTFRYLPENRANQEERFTLNLDLVHLKSDAEFFTGPEDCSKEDIVDYQDSDKGSRRTYSIVVKREAAKPIITRENKLAKAKEFAAVLGIEQKKIDSAKNMDELLSLAPSADAETAERLIVFYNDILTLDESLANVHFLKALAEEKAAEKDPSKKDDAILSYEKAMRIDSKYFIQSVSSGQRIPNDDLKLRATLKIIGFVKQKDVPSDAFIKSVQRGLGISPVDGIVGQRTSGEINRILNELKRMNVLGNPNNVNLELGKDYYVIPSYGNDISLKEHFAELQENIPIISAVKKEPERFSMFLNSAEHRILFDRDKNDYFIEGTETSARLGNSPAVVFIVPRVEIADKKPEIPPSRVNYVYFDDKNANEQKYTDAVYRISLDNNLDPKITKAFIQKETGGKWNADALSYCGAVGLMQIMPCTGAGRECFDNTGIDTGNYLRTYCFGNKDAYNCEVNKKRVDSGNDPIANKLKDPEFNILCGVQYINFLKKNSGGEIYDIALLYNNNNKEYANDVKANYDTLQKKEADNIPDN